MVKLIISCEEAVWKYYTCKDLFGPEEQCSATFYTFLMILFAVHN